MDWALTTLRHAGLMLWQTFWALVLGFGISAALQVFVSKEQMNRLFGRASLSSMSMATLFGAASSSCSYAAVAAGRSAFIKGANLTVAIAFMFASTNLVVELGAVLWVLMGWQFVVAELVGAIVMIGLMWLLMLSFFSPRVENEARIRATRAADEPDECRHDHDHSQHDHAGVHKQNTRWTQLAKRFLDGLEHVVERNFRWFHHCRVPLRRSANHMVEGSVYPGR